MLKVQFILQNTFKNDRKRVLQNLHFDSLFKLLFWFLKPAYSNW